MRLTTVVVMAALAGCAGPARREFRDGAPVRAAPVEPITTYTPAGAGLPEYWGSPVPAMERSPHARVLPETERTRREDGLWAAKEPDGDEPTSGSLLGILLPPMEGAHTAEDFAPMSKCGGLLKASARRADTADAFERAAGDVRRCVAATLYRDCMRHAVQRDRGYKASGERYDHEKERRNLATFKSASEFEQRACPGLPIPPDVTHAYAVTLADFINSWRD